MLPWLFQISTILKLPADLRTPAQKEMLELSPDVVLRCEMNKAKREQTKSRLEEVLIVTWKI